MGIKPSMAHKKLIFSALLQSAFAVINQLFKLLNMSKVTAKDTAGNVPLIEPRGFELEISDLRKKIANFLITQKTTSGIVVQKENYKLTKSAEKLYRLEGKEKNGIEYSVIIATGNYFSMKDNKIVGLLELSEIELNRAIQANHQSLESFFSACLDRLDDDSLALISPAKNKYNWKEIIDWDVFSQEQIFLKLKPNTIALLIIVLDEEFKKLFMQRTTMKQKKIVNDELFYLNQGSIELSPHTKNKTLFDLDLAKKEFNQVIDKLIHAREANSFKKRAPETIKQ